MTDLGRKGIDAKFDHALDLAAQVEYFVADYFSTEPIELHPVDDNPLGMARVTVRNELDEIALGIIVGDAMHSARTALDHLAFRLIEICGGTPGRSTQFPIHDEYTGFGTLVRGNLNGASSAIRQMVKDVKPYGGGDDNFLVLHQLDIADKHHMILPTVFTASALMLQIQTGRREDGKMVYGPGRTELMIPAKDPDPVVGGLLVQRPGADPDESDDNPEQMIGIRTQHGPVFSIDITSSAARSRMKVTDVTKLITDVRAAVEPLVQLVV